MGDHVVQLAGDAVALFQHGATGPLLGGDAGLLDELVPGLTATAQGGSEEDDDSEQGHREHA